MAESEGFEPPIALRLCLISSQVHSTGLCQLSAFLYFISPMRVAACPSPFIENPRIYPHLKGQRKIVDHQWTPGWTPSLEQWLREQALAAGFDTAGIASVDPAPNDLAAQRFADWIAQGRAGEMDYLKRRDDHGTLLRSAVQVAVP